MMEGMTNAEIVPISVKCRRICGYNVPCLKNYAWEGNKVIFEQGWFGESNVQLIFSGES